MLRVPVPCAIPVLVAGKAVHLLGGTARRRQHLPRLDPAAGWIAAGAALFRRRFRGRADFAARAGLEYRKRGAAPARRTAAPRSTAAPGGARPARATRAGDRRLPGAPQQPVSATRAFALLG